MSMSEDLSSVKCEFLWGTWGQCLGAGQVTWEEGPPGWAKGRSQDSLCYRVLGLGEQLNTAKGKALLVAVSCEPMFLFLFFVNIPLVLLMGKKLNPNFLALSQKLSMALDSGIGIFLGRKEHIQCIPRVPLLLTQLWGLTEPAVPAPRCPSPLWCPSPSSCFAGLCVAFPAAVPRLSSMAWLP